MDNQKYQHLSAEERAVLQLGLKQAQSLRSIAAQLNRSHTTLSREVARSAQETQPDYLAAVGGAQYRSARKNSRRKRKLAEDSVLFQTVSNQLRYRVWSPQQISRRLKHMHPDDPSQQVSHETIYAAIYAYPRGALREQMIAELRQRKPKRGRRRTVAQAGPVRVPKAQTIAHRPADIGKRELPGHWEGDLIKGAFNRSAVGTLVERKTRFVVLCRMDGCGAQAALEGFSRQMKQLPAFLRESLTYDRGSEMALHEELSRRLSIDIWFADPYSPWQRGTNENTNGLVRQFLPKGMDLSQLTQLELNDIARLLNGRPRQTLNWFTPEEAMAEELEKQGKAHRAGAALPGGYSQGEVLKVWQPGPDSAMKLRSGQHEGPRKGPLLV